MLVSVCKPWGPRCFKCILDMPSIPAAAEYFSCFITLDVSSVVASIIVKSNWNLWLRLSMHLSSHFLGRLLILE